MVWGFLQNAETSYETALCVIYIPWYTTKSIAKENITRTSEAGQAGAGADKVVSGQVA